MANTLLGDHYQILCQDCGYGYPCDADVRPATGDVFCPNCGAKQPLPPNAPLVRGDRILIDSLAYWMRGPRRGELIAFRDPLNGDQLSVKRVVGLPGERIAIRSGNVLIDGQRHGRSQVSQAAKAILVNDDTYRGKPRRGSGSRWHPESQPSGWKGIGAGFAFTVLRKEGARPQGDTLDWLTYGHQSPYAAAGRLADAPVRDSCGYNQGVSRRLYPVGELMLRCRVRVLESVDKLVFSIHDGSERWEAEIGPAEQPVVLRGDRTEIQGAKPGRFPQDYHVSVEYSVFDQRVVLAMDGRIVLSHEYAAHLNRPNPVCHPLRIGVSGGKLELRGLRVLRDRYYHPPPAHADWRMVHPLGAAHFFVLGDNPPISLDSRHSPDFSLHLNRVVGRVLPFPLDR